MGNLCSYLLAVGVSWASQAITAWYVELFEVMGLWYF